jgi:hypothetical protein
MSAKFVSLALLISFNYYTATLLTAKYGSQNGYLLFPVIAIYGWDFNLSALRPQKSRKNYLKAAAQAAKHYNKNNSPKDQSSVLFNPNLPYFKNKILSFNK